MRPSTRILCALERSRPRDGNSLGRSSCLGSPRCALPRLTPRVAEPPLSPRSWAPCNTVTAEATEPLWLEMFCHLLPGALSLGQRCREEGKSLSSEWSEYVRRGCCHPSLFFRLNGGSAPSVFSRYKLSLRGWAALSATFLLFLTLLALQDKEHGFCPVPCPACVGSWFRKTVPSAINK